MAENQNLSNGWGGRLYGWFDSRLKINVLVEYMSDKVVPLHGHSIFYYFGGISLFLLIVKGVTGILLLM